MRSGIQQERIINDFPHVRTTELTEVVFGPSCTVDHSSVVAAADYFPSPSLGLILSQNAMAKIKKTAPARMAGKTQ